ncbi:MAG: lyase family protein [Beijerinckiaceae bacterium]|nr:lyase family protein [Beijerinckiaceae bacterium]
MSLTDAFSTSPALAKEMSDQALITGVFAFEAALAQAQALEGVIPSAAAQAITQAVSQIQVTPEDVAAEAARAGALTMPLVKLLIGAVRGRDAPAAVYVHFGATSQDAMDTALVLQLDKAIALIDANIARVANAAARLAQTHRNTIMLGRTLLQPATPISFGQKAAQWLLAACEDRTRLRDAARDALRIQFGGASGNLGSLGEKGEAVSTRLASLLPLRFGAPANGAVAPWHTRRGNLLNLSAAFTIATIGASKMARDISLMAQWEVGELAEPSEEGRGVSSAMPHKQNPVRCMTTISAGLRAPGLLATLMSGAIQEHERALGGWQAEWSTLPELVKIAGGAIVNMADTLEGLVVDPARMRANFDQLRGLPLAEIAALALAPAMGRDAAHALVAQASRGVLVNQTTLADELARDPVAGAHFTTADLSVALDPQQALGASSTFIDAALAAWRNQTATFKMEK